MKYLLFFALAWCAYAQNAQVAGLVKDQSSADLPNARVQIRNVDTGVERSAVTGDGGLYSIPELSPGRYTITVQHEGFQTVVRNGIVLEVSQNARIDFTLQVGATEQQVTVLADAPLVNTTDASVSTVVDRQFVENMPLNGRSFQSLITLTPGVVTTLSSGSGGDQGQFSVAGQRAGSNYFIIDGASANFAASEIKMASQTSNGGLPALSAVGSTTSLVSTDALQEFRLQSSTYAPEYGRQSGGQVILLTRSGTNQFHGTAFDYFRNDALDANDWFANSTGLAKPRERQNDFGGVLGGPIQRNKTFFFFSYEGLRAAQPTISIVDVPSLDARATAEPSIKALINAFPLPNGPSTGVDLAQLAADPPILSNLDATSLRIDRAIGSKLTVFGRYNHSPSSVNQHGCYFSLDMVCSKPVFIDTGTVGVTALLTPAITNDFRFNYSRAHAISSFFLTDFGGAQIPPNSALFSPYADPSTGWAGIYIANGRSTSIYQGMYVDHTNRQTNLTDSMEIVIGNHSMKIGFDFRRLTPIGNSGDNISLYNWLSGNAMHDFATGAAPDFSSTIVSPNSPRLFFHNFSSFWQDTWKPSRRMTVTYGVRWDYNPPPTEANGNIYALSETTDLRTATLLPKGSPLWHPDWKNFAPRAGISYLLRPDSPHSTVIRAGFGQFYDLGTSTAGMLDMGQPGWFPYSLQLTLCNYGSGPACNGSVPYNGPKPPFVFTPPYTVMKIFDPHLKLPYSLEWSFAIEQTLSPSQSLKVTYVGSAGRRLLRDQMISNPNPTFSGLDLSTNAGYSNYEGLQIQFQRRLSRGLQALASYSWSHSLDTNSSDVTFGGNGDDPGLPINLVKVRQDYGDSDFDIRHTFSSAVTYSIPTGNLQNPFARAIFRDWSIDGIATARTATPFSVTYTPANPGQYLGLFGALALRPDQVTGQPVYISDPNAPGGKKINPAAFTVPSSLRQGSETRNSLRAFPLVQIDLSIRRQFSLTEQVHLLVRVDAFNVMNHPNFGSPLSTIGTCANGSPCTPMYGFGISQSMLSQALGGGAGGFYGSSFGSLYQVGGPRSLQLSMKLQF